MKLPDVKAWVHDRPAIAAVALGALGVLIIVVGVLGVRSSAADSAKLKELRAGAGVTVTGTLDGTETVVRKRAPNLPDKVSYCPRYTYTTPDGLQGAIVDRDDCASNAKRLVGRTVQILVDKNDSNTAFIDENESAVGRGSFDIFAWSMLTLGFALVIIAIVRLVRMRRGRRIDSAGTVPTP
jgi:hypothetical protein